MNVLIEISFLHVGTYIISLIMSIQEERSLWKSVVSQAKRGQATRGTLQSICDQVADLVTEFLALMNKSCLVGSVDDGNFEERNNETTILIRNCLGPLFGFSDSIDPIAILLDEELVEELLIFEEEALTFEEDGSGQASSIDELDESALRIDSIRKTQAISISRG